MSGIGPAFDQDGSGAANPAPRETARVVADPAATGTAPARTDAAAAAPAVKTASADTSTATTSSKAPLGSDAAAVDVAPATVDAAALPDAATAPLTPPVQVTQAAPAATATAALPAKPVATVQVPPARPVASPTDAGSLGGLVFSLLLIVGLILALGWFARRMPGFGGGAATKHGLRVVASLPVGARERVVVVDVGGTQLLLGVGSGGVRTLHTLDQPLPDTATGAPSPFAQVLAQHFGKKA